VHINLAGQGPLFEYAEPSGRHPVPSWLTAWFEERPACHERLREYAKGSYPRAALTETLIDLAKWDAAVREGADKFVIDAGRALLAEQALLAGEQDIACIEEAWDLVFLAMPEIAWIHIERHDDGPLIAAFKSGYMMRKSPYWPFPVARPKGVRNLSA
jgi:hypothetical protein